MQHYDISGGHDVTTKWWIAMSFMILFVMVVFFDFIHVDVCNTSDVDLWPQEDVIPNFY